MLPYIVQNRIDNKERFDLYFAGSQNVKCDDVLAERLCPRLFSQFNDRSGIKHWLEYPDSGKLFIDSGAHSAHTRGLDIDPDDYIEYVNNLDDKIYVYAQLDKIPGRYLQPKTVEDWQEAPRLSWENYLYMRDRVVSPDKIMPVFHQGENFKWLVNMLESTFSGKHIPYIGLSPRGDVKVRDKIAFLSRCFSVINKSSNPNVKTHALGMTSLDVLEMFPLYSADSTTWLLVGAMGQIYTPWGLVYVSEKGKNKPDHIDNMPKQAVDRVVDYVSKYNFNLDTLMEDYAARMIFNIVYLDEWSKNYVYKGVQNKVNSLF